MDRTLVFSTAGILTLAGVGFALSLSRSTSSSSTSSSVAVLSAPEPPSERGSTIAPSVALPLTVPAAPLATPGDASVALSEDALMGKLRELKATAPLLSLELAREGIDRFPDTPDAAERAWFVVKSLSDLGRHDEAREEARKMLERFPHNQFTRDVVRHTLIHPPTPAPPRT